MGKAKKKKVHKQNKQDNIQKKGTNKLLIALVCIAAAAVISVFTVAVVLLDQQDESLPEFVPPEFDSGSCEGVPSVSDSDKRMYGLISDVKMPYTFYICRNINTSSDGEGEIYFTNPAENTLWMKLRIYDNKGKVIGETGLIKPGEYLKAVRFDTVPENGTIITMRVMTYEPETYCSGGEVTIEAKTIGK